MRAPSTEASPPPRRHRTLEADPVSTPVAEARSVEGLLYVHVEQQHVEQNLHMRLRLLRSFDDSVAQPAASSAQPSVVEREIAILQPFHSDGDRILDIDDRHPYRTRSRRGPASAPIVLSPHGRTDPAAKGGRSCRPRSGTLSDRAATAHALLPSKATRPRSSFLDDAQKRRCFDGERRSTHITPRHAHLAGRAVRRCRLQPGIRVKLKSLGRARLGEVGQLPCPILGCLVNE